MSYMPYCLRICSFIFFKYTAKYTAINAAHDFDTKPGMVSRFYSLKQCQACLLVTSIERAIS